MRLAWLQGQIPEDTLLGFSSRWRKRLNERLNPTAISLVDACRYYKDLSIQNDALTWLEGEIALDLLKNFTRRWQQ